MKKESEKKTKPQEKQVLAKNDSNSIPRSEYPRPECFRSEESWLCLNGWWDFEFDPKGIGMNQEWFKSPKFSKKILVPFVYQSQLSGINDQSCIDYIWYARTFTVPKELSQKHILLHFGAVDYDCSLFINGTLVGSHHGGFSSFFFDITSFITAEKTNPQSIILQVHDYPYDQAIPRGKQNMDKKAFSGCTYERISGIWQTVWLEFVNDVYFDRSDYYLRADPFTGKVSALFQIHRPENRSFALECQLFDGTKPISELNFAMLQGPFNNNQLIAADVTLSVDTRSIVPWCPEHPQLYRAHFRLIDADSDDEAVVDEIDCLFGFRSIETKNGQFLLNGKPIYLKFALYQGYWTDGLWTPPSDAAIQKDFQLMFEMGLNGLRLHQKVEEPRLIYWADKMGVLLWGEIANAFANSTASKENLLQEWIARVKRDRSHPSIIAWIPANESWGVTPLDHIDAQEYLKALYHTTKFLDPTRPVNTNDGWEMVNGATDICSFHLYVQPDKWIETLPETRPKSMKDFKGHNRIYAPGNDYMNEPVVVSEWGGWGLYFDDPNAKPDSFKCWGYQGILYKSWDDVLDLYRKEIEALVKRKSWIVGHIYTEFCDQYQEMNGFLTFDRCPKGDLKKLKAINDLL